jgi:hypothetical protein
MFVQSRTTYLASSVIAADLVDILVRSNALLRVLRDEFVVDWQYLGICDQ